jgi:DNA repair photolyase
MSAWDTAPAIRSSAAMPKKFHAPKPPAETIAPLKGRGSVVNMDHRFAGWDRAPVDDGWRSGYEEEPEPLKTIVVEERAKSILTHNDSPDIFFSQSINPYRGCEHGCVYCFARPTHSYLNLSPGLDFETRLFAKVNAPELLIEALSKRSYRCENIALGVNTDAYQPIEKEYRITRRILEICSEFNQPIGLITKSSLVERDIDILAPMAARNLTYVTLSVTTLDHAVSRFMEPRTTAPRRRIEAIRNLVQAGIPVSVNVAPVVPFLTDSELERILEAACDAGAHAAGYLLLRLPWEVKDIFKTWLETHFPLKAAHVMSRLHAMRDGRDNDANFGSRMVGSGIYAELLDQRFNAACKRLGINEYGRRRMRGLDVSQFRVPTPQLGLF